MIEYVGPLAAVIQRGDNLEYLLAESSAGKLRLRGGGTCRWDELISRDHPLRGCKLIYGLGHGTYATRRLSLDRAMAADQDQLQWELGRGLTEKPGDYHQTTLPVAGGPAQRFLSFAAKRRTVEQLGSRFVAQGLTLTQLTFEPVALFHVCRPLGGVGRTLLLHLETERAQLLLLYNRQVVTCNTLNLRHHDAAAHRMLAEDIGTVLLATPYGRTVERKLELILSGVPTTADFVGALKAALPYDLVLRSPRIADFDVDCDAGLARQFGCWFLPYSLLHLYRESRLCASLPANDAASSSAP